MRRAFWLPLLLCAFAAVCSPASAEDRAVTFFEKIKVLPNGDALWTLRTEIRILSSSAISVSQDQTVSSVPDRAELQSVAAYTLKKDGRKLEIAAGEMKPLSRTGNDAGWDVNETRKAIHFPDVSTGDTVVLETVTLAKATFPGAFMFNRKAQDYFDIGEDIEIFVPASMTLTVEAYEYDVRQEKSQEGTTWFIRHEGGRRPPELGQYVWTRDRGARVYGSTFKDYGEEAAAYAELIRSKGEVTPVVQAKADAITAGTADRREQARKLFEWVRDNITYTAKTFEIGHGIPISSATETLQAGRGDCKAQVLLYTTLLKAKGIEAYMVALNGTNGYSLPKPATLAPFNHAVTWLPEWNIFADATARTNDFDSIGYSLYGKPVMRIGYKGPATGTVPLLDATQSWITTDTAATLDERGRLSGTVSVKGHGVAGSVLRSLALSDAAKDPARLAERILKMNRMSSASGSFAFPPADRPTNDYAYSGSFKDDSDNGRRFAVPRGLIFARMEGANIMGPIADKKFKDADPVACYAVHDVETYALQLPASLKPAALPANQSVKTANLDYTQQWTLDGSKLIARHELTTRFDSPLCSGATRRDVLAALDKIGQAFNTEVALVPAK